MEWRVADAELGEVVVCRSPRARRIRLTVRADGRVRVAYPWRMARETAMEFLEQHRAWVLATRERLAARKTGSPACTPEEIERLRREARRLLPPRVGELAARYGFSYGRVSIRASRTRWGSCSGRNDLSLSLFLMTLPEHLRDFVILHELCHTVHHNHSAAFHALLDRCTGGREAVLNRELRRCTTGK